MKGFGKMSHDVLSKLSAYGRKALPGMADLKVIAVMIGGGYVALALVAIVLGQFQIVAQGISGANSAPDNICIAALTMIMTVVNFYPIIVLCILAGYAMIYLGLMGGQAAPAGKGKR